MTSRNTQFSFPKQTGYYQGKVRDVYSISDKYLLLIASDRISAFDHILPKPIPYKGEVLNLMAAFFLRQTENLVPNWLIDVPDPAVSLGYKCEPFKVEMVVRNYLVGHAWREYKSGKRTICGIQLPDGLNEYDKFENPIITPTTKADEGHDEDISKEEIIEQNIVSVEDYAILEDYALKLFEHGKKHAEKRDLILADTKYEFGKKGKEIMLIDEIHTPDSSRYFHKTGFREKVDHGERPEQLSKEFVREWLMEKGFQGKDGQEMPEMTDEFIAAVQEKYIKLYEHITGEDFNLSDRSQFEQRLQKNVKQGLSKLNII